jgi:hypothetical protein
MCGACGASDALDRASRRWLEHRLLHQHRVALLGASRSGSRYRTASRFSMLQCAAILEVASARGCTQVARVAQVTQVAQVAQVARNSIVRMQRASFTQRFNALAPPPAVPLDASRHAPAFCTATRRREGLLRCSS